MTIKNFLGKLLGKGGSAEPRPVVSIPEAKVTKGASSKLKVLTAILDKFQDTERVLDYLRTGEYVILLKVKSLKEKDITELKRAINRIRTHCDATGADIAALDDTWVLVVPSTVFIERSSQQAAPQVQAK